MFKFRYDFNKNGQSWCTDYYTGSFNGIVWEDISKVNGVILNDKDEICLVWDKDSKEWFIPGGDKQKHENPTQCLVRELLNQVSIVVNLGSIKPAYYESMYHIKGREEIFDHIRLRFIARAYQVDKLHQATTKESHKIMWVPPNEIKDYIAGDQVVEIIVNAVQDYLG